MRIRALLHALTGVFSVVVALTMVSGCTAATVPEPTRTSSGWDDHGPIVLAIGSDPTGVWSRVLATWNQAHPSEPVTVQELGGSSDQQHAELVKRGEEKDGELTVMALDLNWTAEFAEKGWVSELPSGSFPTTGLMAQAVSAGSFSGGLYLYPQALDVGLLYYRKDLLAARGLKAPTTWTQLVQDCQQILNGRKDVSCYGGQFGQTDDLTINAAEWISASGGALFSKSGTPQADGSGTRTAINRLVAAFKAQTIPAEALNWTQERSRTAFEDGKLVFLRDGTSTDALTVGASSVSAERYGVALLPADSGATTSVLTGQGLAISSTGENKGTAADFVRWVAEAPAQRIFVEYGTSAPVQSSFYTDAALIKRYPYLALVAKELQSAKTLPATTKYAEVSSAVQSAVHSVLTGEKESAAALSDLQSKLTELLK